MKQENNKTSKKRTFWTKILILINAFFVFCLLIAYLAPFISPDSVWMIAFFGLSYHIFLIINLFFIFYWIFRQRWWFAFSLFVVLIGWGHLRTSFQFNIKKKFQPEDKVFKVLTYNVRNFDLFNYTGSWKINHKNRKNIISFLQKESPDIICFQEYVFEENGHFKTGDTLKKLLTASNIHEHFTTKSNSYHYGVATMSAYPIINKGVITFAEQSNNVCIYSDIKFMDDTIRVYNAHLASIHFTIEDYKFTKRLTNLNDAEHQKEFKKGFIRIMRLLKNAFQRRADQAKILSKHLKSSPYPVIICGDFNDTPISYTYRSVAKGLNDAFVVAGKGFGVTYKKIFPNFRIDYILFSDFFEVLNYETIPVKYSDHHPIKAYLKVADPSK